jgi:hypothetical protein
MGNGMPAKCLGLRVIEGTAIGLANGGTSGRNDNGITHCQTPGIRPEVAPEQHVCLTGHHCALAALPSGLSKTLTLPPHLTDAATGTHSTLLYRHGGEWQPITGIIWPPSEKTSKIGRKHPEFFCFSAFRHRQNRQAGLSLKA